MRYNGKYVKASAPVAVGTLMMRIAAVLLCLVLFSLHLMSGLYAKYTSSGNGDDTARVAKFEVKVDDDEDAVSISSASGSNGTYSFTIENKSEVAVRYTLSVHLASKDADPKYDLSAVTASFDSNSGTLAPGAAPVSHTLTLNVDWAKFTKNVTGASAAANLSFTVTVHVDQVD